MTIGGALSDLDNLLKADDIPCYYKPSIKAVIDTIALDQETKTGHWIEEFVDTEGEVRFTCSCCGKYQLFGTDFCYNCGAKMEEVEDENVNKRSI